MKKFNKFMPVLILAGALCLMLAGQVRPESVDAATVVGYQTIEADAGATPYTVTTYTTAYLSGSFGDMVVQVNSDISGTGTLTVTPQFSNSRTGCASITDWADATISAIFATRTTTNTDTVTFSVNTVLNTIVGDGATLMGFPSQGRCMRVKMAASTTFTPAVYIRMANTSN